MIARNENFGREEIDKKRAAEYCCQLLPKVRSGLEERLPYLEGIKFFTSLGSDPARIDLDYVIEDNCDSYEFQTYELKKIINDIITPIIGQVADNDNFEVIESDSYFERGLICYQLIPNLHKLKQ